MRKKIPQEQVDYVVNNHGEISISDMAANLGCDRSKIEYLITRHIHPQGERELKHCNPPNADIRELFHALLYIDKMAKLRGVEISTSELVGETIAYFHQQRRLEKGKTHINDGAWASKVQKARFQRKRSEGQCVRCGEPIDTERSTWYCTKHLNMMNDYYRKRQEKLYGKGS